MRNIRKKKYIFIHLVILLSGKILTIQENNTEAFSNQVIQRGSAGDDVIELQSRLKYIGFYKGEIDGFFAGEHIGHFGIFNLNSDSLSMG